MVAIPEHFSAAQEQRWVVEMRRRVVEQAERRKRSDHQLLARAELLNKKYLHGAATPRSVQWTSGQRRVWGTCCPQSGNIRVSTALAQMPEWVLDYVLVHELVHLLEPGHTERFWAFVGMYPHTDRARGFLEGYAFHADSTGPSSTATTAQNESCGA